MYQSSPIKIWRKYKSRYRLVGTVCNKCGKKHYPPVMMCTKCFSTDLQQYEFKSSAKLITWSSISASPKGFEFNQPYIVGIIELEDGERVTTQIVDVEFENLKYGMELIPTFRKIFIDGEQGIIHYGIKFTKAK
jgi:uncharacterized OB-fold protein